MCDSVVATAPHTANGTTIFGKNSDRTTGECQPFVQFPRAHYPGDDDLACTHITIPQAREKHRVMGHSPWWIWGFEHGVNEHGLAIGNQAVFSREPVEETPGLIGMDLVRLGLERARDCEEAVDVITQLLETHGQGGAGFAPNASGYHNSFMIADPHAAWVLETSGRHWAARSVERTGLSNHISQADDWQRASPDLEAFAKEQGWWDGASRLDVEAAFRNTGVPRVLSDGRLRRSRELLERSQGELTVCDVMNLLRDHGEGECAPVTGATPQEERFFTLCVHEDPPGPTTASMVVELSKPTAKRRARPAWISFHVPCFGVFLPVYLDAVVPASMAAGGEQYDAEAMWWTFHDLEYAASLDPVANHAILREGWMNFESEIEFVRNAAERGADQAFADGDDDIAEGILSDAMNELATRAITTAKDLCNRMVAGKASQPSDAR
jgi:secernin